MTKKAGQFYRRLSATSSHLTSRRQRFSTEAKKACQPWRPDKRDVVFGAYRQVLPVRAISASRTARGVGSIRSDHAAEFRRRRWAGQAGVKCTPRVVCVKEVQSELL